MCSVCVCDSVNKLSRGAAGRNQVPPYPRLSFPWSLAAVPTKINLMELESVFFSAVSLQSVATGTWMMDITQAACCLSGLVGTASYHPSCSSHAALTAVRRWGRNRLGLSNYLFRPLTVKTGKFVHAAPPPLLKWTARARTGALATRFRLEGTKLVSSSQCLCCPSLEDDAHGDWLPGHRVCGLWKRCIQALA